MLRFISGMATRVDSKQPHELTNSSQLSFFLFILTQDSRTTRAGLMFPLIHRVPLFPCGTCATTGCSVIATMSWRRMTNSSTAPLSTSQGPSSYLPCSSPWPWLLWPPWHSWAHTNSSDTHTSSQSCPVSMVCPFGEEWEGGEVVEPIN